MHGYIMRPVPGAFSLVELLVVVSVLAILAGLLLPAIQMVRSQAFSSGCKNNLRQLVLAQENYADLSDGWYTDLYAGHSSDPWTRRLAVVADIPGPTWKGIFDCAEQRRKYGLNKDHQKDGSAISYPSYYHPSPQRAHYSFGVPGYPLHRSWINNRSSSLFIIEGQCYWGEFAGPKDGTSSFALNYPDERHYSGNNYSFYDGHVEYRKGQMPNLDSASSPWRSW